MSSPEITSLQQAYQEIPERWYERYSSLYRLVKVVNVTSTGAYIGVIVTGNDQILYHLIGAGIFIASAVSDRLTTVRCFDALNRAASNGIATEHQEFNPQLQGVTNSRDFNFHPRAALMDLVGATTSLVLPNLAATFSALKFAASLSNLRVARRYNRATEIAISNLGTN